MNILLQNQIKKAELIGFWDEAHTTLVKRMVESRYNPEIVREYTIADLIIHGDETLIKWEKRFRPLTDEELISLGFELDGENNLDNSKK